MCALHGVRDISHAAEYYTSCSLWMYLMGDTRLPNYSNLVGLYRWIVPVFNACSVR